MHGRTMRATGTAQWLTVLAVLVGLFLMHGGPGSVAGGCHDAMPAMAPGAAAQAQHHPTAPTAAGSRAVPVLGKVTAGLGGAGALCVSTPARDRLPPAPTTLAALIVLALLTGAFGLGGRARVLARRRRGPPGGGREILLRVCIART